MDFEPSEHEPDEYDPEAEFRDPDSDSITIPEAPTPATAESEVPPEVLRTFWIVVAVVNVAILALSLGAMLLVLRGATTRGPVLIAGGAVLLAMAVRRYRSFVASSEEDDADTAGGDGDSGRGSAGDAGEAVPGHADRESEAETVSVAEPEADSPERNPPDNENRTR